MASRIGPIPPPHLNPSLNAPLPFKTAEPARLRCVNTLSSAERSPNGERAGQHGGVAEARDLDARRVGAALLEQRRGWARAAGRRWPRCRRRARRARRRRRRRSARRGGRSGAPPRRPRPARARRRRAPRRRSRARRRAAPARSPAGPRRRARPRRRSRRWRPGRPRARPRGRRRARSRPRRPRRGGRGGARRGGRGRRRGRCRRTGRRSPRRPCATPRERSPTAARLTSFSTVTGTPRRASSSGPIASPSRPGMLAASTICPPGACRPRPARR